MKSHWTVALLVFAFCAGLGEGQRTSSSRGPGRGMSTRGSFRAGLFNSELMENPYMMAMMMSNMMGMRGTQSFNLPLMLLLQGSGLEIMPMDSLMSFFLMQSLFNNPAPEVPQSPIQGMSQLPITDVSFLLPQLVTGSSNSVGMLGSSGGMLGSSGGMLGSSGGMLGSSGGMLGSSGGKLGSSGGMLGSSGGMLGSSASAAGSAA